MSIYTARFWQFYTELAKMMPGFQIKYKNESILIKIISKILFFNSSFMTGYVTTLGKTVYFPSRTQLETMYSLRPLGILAHEYRHSYDNQKWSIGFPLIYLLPQILAAFSLLSLLAIWLSPWWLLSLLALFFLAPIPSPGRKLIEFNGYTMSLFMANEFLKESGVEEIERRTRLLSLAARYDENFIGAAYYYMWPFGVRESLVNKVEKIISAEILQDDVIYSQMVLALSKTK